METINGKRFQAIPDHVLLLVKEKAPDRLLKSRFDFSQNELNAIYELNKQVVILNRLEDGIYYWDAWRI